MLPKEVGGSLPRSQNRGNMVISGTEKAYKCPETSYSKVCSTDLHPRKISENNPLETTHYPHLSF